ncbi:DegT/DnrJ/EryC1/StrS family aminotransferase [Chryseolinea sp. T2]|uniref:DegT/DnrJ/EryC1/StrS family aminotransferase n=1 Tax=Chryseolinea sp. T2 TaxID=3129255 RepID=UPI00307878FC
MKIQMVDLNTQYQRIREEINTALQNVLDTAGFIQGKQVGEFARTLSEFLKVRSVIPCANGTDALQIAMMALNFKPGDEVIVPVHTYVATAEVMALLGLKPVFVDVSDDTFNLDIAAVENVITDRTVAIVPVHLYGQCADMEPLLKLARKHELHVIEDAAQAFGSVYTFSSGDRAHAGTMATVGTTSFFPSKNLGCYGDGGAIFTQDEALGERMRMIANHGQRVKYHHEIVGVNSRLDTLQAAILQVKFKYVEEYEAKRNAVAEVYDQSFANHAGIRIPGRASNSTHVFHQYTIQVSAADRDALKEHLLRQEIPTMIYYPVPLHLQKAFAREEYPAGSFPITERLSKTVLSLPIHTEMTAEQLEHITKSVLGYFQ